MPATKVNLSQMVDLAVITPRVGAVNSNALHTLLHAMLRQLNIVDVQAEANFNDYDRDVLSALKARELSVLSDIDSGVGDDAEDSLGLALGDRSSFMPTATPSTGKRTPHQWHHQVDAEDTFRLRLSIDSKRSSCMPIPRLRTGKRTPQHHQVASIQDPEEKLNNISSVPSNSNKHLFKRATTPNKGNPIVEMWLSMLLFRVQTNEKGIDKCMSMIEDLTKEMQAHRDEHKIQMDQIKGLNIDDIMMRINAMEKSMNEMNDKVYTLLSPDDFAKFVTEAELEDALQGTRQDWENLQQPMGRVVVEMSSQTDPVADMRKKLDQGALDGLNVSSEILEQLRELKEQVDTLAVVREKISDPIQDLLRHEHEMHTLTITELQMKFAMLEDELYQIQNMIEHDSTRWEIKHGTKYEEEIRNVFLQNEPDKTRNLAYVVNDQQHDIREDIITMEEDLKIKAIQFVEIPFVQAKPEPVEIPSELTKSAGFKDTKLFAYSDELQVNKADGTEVGIATYCDELQVNNADRTEVAISTYCDELQVNNAIRTEVAVATYSDELQVNNAFRTEVGVATYCDELQVNNADRTEVTIATYSDELQVNKADRTEMAIATYCEELQVNNADRTEVTIATYCEELQVNNADRTEVTIATYCEELQVNKADRTEVTIATYCEELQVNKADRTEVTIATYCEELQMNKADRTEVTIATYSDELQVNKADRTEMAIATYCEELQVNNADRTEVTIATYCEELQVNNADRTEVTIATYCEELQVNKADRTEVTIATYCEELQVNKADRTEVTIATYCEELQVNKADRTEVTIATYCDELQVNNADRTEVTIATYCEELQVNKADRTEVTIATYSDELQVNNAIRTEVDVATYCEELQVNKADRTEVDVKADKRTLENHSLFDTKTNDINKMIKKILNNLAVKDEAWNRQCKVFSDDIDRKLNHFELKSLKEWLLRRLEALNDQLNEQNQAPVRRLEALNDKLPTGDTSTFSSSSESNSLFDTETNDSKMIKEILIIIAVNEEAWNQQCKVFSDDIDGKLDDLEFKPVKDWLLRRLKKLNDRLKKQNQGHVRRLKTLNDMLPTGPVPSSMTSVSSHQALHPTISPRPDLNFEMDQILQHSKSDTVKQEAKKRKYGQKVVKFISKMMKPCRKAKSQ